jgi:hypothetical protein
MAVSCGGSPNPAVVNESVTWSAVVSGGTTPYTYSWTGTDGISGTTASVIKTYTTTGTKNASVTVTDAGAQSTTANCSVNVGIPGFERREVIP